MTSPRLNLSKKVGAMVNCPEFGNLEFAAKIAMITEKKNAGNLQGPMLEEYDPEVLMAGEVLLILRFGARAKPSPCKWWSAVPKKKKSPRPTRKATVEALNCPPKKQKKRKFRDSSYVILEEGCEMRGGEVPAWVEATVRDLGGSNARLVVQKKLFDSDVTTGQSRFSIPKGKIAHGFLTSEESELLNDGKKIEVSLIQPCGKTSQLLLAKWRLSSSSSYVLTKNWTSVWKEPRNGLGKGEEVQLWSYRVGGKLCFWLVNVRNPVQDLLERGRPSNTDLGIVCFEYDVFYILDEGRGG